MPLISDSKITVHAIKFTKSYGLLSPFFRVLVSGRSCTSLIAFTSSVLRCSTWRSAEDKCSFCFQRYSGDINVFPLSVFEVLRPIILAQNYSQIISLKIAWVCILSVVVFQSEKPYWVVSSAYFLYSWQKLNTIFFVIFQSGVAEKELTMNVQLKRRVAVLEKELERLGSEAELHAQRIGDKNNQVSRAPRTSFRKGKLSEIAALPWLWLELLVLVLTAPFAFIGTTLPQKSGITSPRSLHDRRIEGCFTCFFRHAEIFVRAWTSRWRNAACCLDAGDRERCGKTLTCDDTTNTQRRDAKALFVSAVQKSVSLLPRLERHVCSTQWHLCSAQRLTADVFTGKFEGVGGTARESLKSHRFVTHACCEYVPRFWESSV